MWSSAGLQMPIHTHIYRPAIWTSKVGQGDLVFDLRSGFASGSVRARLQVSVYNGYGLHHPGCPKIDSYILTPMTLKSRSNPRLVYIHVRCIHDANLVTAGHHFTSLCVHRGKGYCLPYFSSASTPSHLHPNFSLSVQIRRWTPWLQTEKFLLIFRVNWLLMLLLKQHVCLYFSTVAISSVEHDMLTYYASFPITGRTTFHPSGSSGLVLT